MMRYGLGEQILIKAHVLAIEDTADGLPFKVRMGEYPVHVVWIPEDCILGLATPPIMRAIEGKADTAPALAAPTGELIVSEPILYGLWSGIVKNWIPETHVDFEGPVWHTEHQGLAFAEWRRCQSTFNSLSVKIIGPHGEPLDLPEVSDRAE
ncbi:MAG TPA: hypothetical protein VM537_21240 [Anaerolineae bacterium]|nr:hypothetical protein [Anaerolineae bacterium]